MGELNITSSKIRERIIRAGKTFKSNDCIADFIHKTEIDELIEEVASGFMIVLDQLVIDQDNDPNAKDTAKRLAKMYINEIFSGRYLPPPDITKFPNVKTYDQLYVTGPITIRSVCAHHFQNITGVAYIGVYPGTNVIGLSKFNRIVDWFASRPTIQEELTIQIADEIEKVTGASGVAVLIKASHGCMTARGVCEHTSDFTTSDVRGALRNNNKLKEEFFQILSGMKGWGL